MVYSKYSSQSAHVMSIQFKNNPDSIKDADILDSFVASIEDTDRYKNASYLVYKQNKSLYMKYFKSIREKHLNELMSKSLLKSTNNINKI